MVAFINKCLVKDYEARSTAAALLSVCYLLQ